MNRPLHLWRDRLQASLLHLGLSLAIATFAAGLVFGLWYRYPYREISGGRELFWLVVSVDVVLGPLVTFAIFDRRKSWSKLRFDLWVIALLQAAALTYGMWTVFIARPVHLVFEYHRFNVVHAIDVATSELPLAGTGFNRLPLGGPTLASLRSFASEDEKASMTLLAIQGLALPVRPKLWQAYELVLDDIKKAAKPVAELKTRFPRDLVSIDQALANTGLNPVTALYVPMIGRKTFWTALLDPATMKPVAFLPLDSF